MGRLSPNDGRIASTRLGIERMGLMIQIGTQDPRFTAILERNTQSYAALCIRERKVRSWNLDTSRCRNCTLKVGSTVPIGAAAIRAGAESIINWPADLGLHIMSNLVPFGVKFVHTLQAVLFYEITTCHFERMASNECVDTSTEALDKTGDVAAAMSISFSGINFDRCRQGVKHAGNIKALTCIDAGSREVIALNEIDITLYSDHGLMFRFDAFHHNQATGLMHEAHQTRQDAMHERICSRFSDHGAIQFDNVR